jgi:nitroreductase
MDNETLQTIRTRRSCRNYKPQQITDEELQAVLEAGTWAPTGKGLQDPWIVAVQDKKLRDRISKLNASIMGSTGDPFYGAPTIVLVFGSPDWANYIQDGSLVLGTMMLAAHSIGLASCWINREIQMFQTPEGKEIARTLGLPENVGGVGALALGYAAAPAREPKARKADYYRIVK